MATSPLSATLIYDGGAAPLVPEQMLPEPRNGKSPTEIIAALKQLVGTPLEQLCELAGRVCYGSLGSEKSRASDGYHKHILEVGHLSVLEHAAFTVRIEASTDTVCSWALGLLNRPGVHVELGPIGALSDQVSFLMVTLNLRHVLEWDRYAQQDRFGRKAQHKNRALGRILRHHAHRLAPQIVSVGDPLAEDECRNMRWGPLLEEQQWVTLLLTGSRGFSHELVRHGDWTAISQRSTRYVDESESPWVEHPLLTARFEDSIKSFATIDPDTRGQLRQKIVVDAQTWYKGAVESLEPWLIARGVDKVSARKQARGAARGYLGNALYTEVVFSANVAQWKRMLRQRLSAFADAEIREVFYQALMELKRCRYASSFEGWTTKPSPDGIGEVLVEPTTSTP